LADVAIAVDLGGTNLRFGLVDEGGKILARRRTVTGAAHGVDTVLSRLIGGIGHIAGKAGQLGHRVAGVGIGVPGIISVDEGVVRFSPNLTGWKDVPLKSAVSDNFPFPVFIENDANAYALGEMRHGAGTGAESLVCITLGTGVGGGIILGGKLWHGADGMAGEVGHMTVEPGGIHCHCGNTGCLERYASATAVVDRFCSALRDGEKSSLKAAFKKDPKGITAKMVDEAARAGDKLAKRVYDDAGRYLGIAMADLINLLNIERIVIGGGLAGAWDLFIGAAKAEVASRAFDIPAKRCKIVRGKLKDDAGIIGAAGLVFMGGKGRR
jgi:glucokinase